MITHRYSHNKEVIKKAALVNTNLFIPALASYSFACEKSTPENPIPNMYEGVKFSY